MYTSTHALALFSDETATLTMWLVWYIICSAGFIGFGYGLYNAGSHEIMRVVNATCWGVCIALMASNPFIGAMLGMGNLSMPIACVVMPILALVIAVSRDWLLVIMSEYKRRNQVTIETGAANALQQRKYDEVIGEVWHRELEPNMYGPTPRKMDALTAAQRAIAARKAQR